VLWFVIRHLHTLPGLIALIRHPPIGSFAAADFYGLSAYYLVDGEGRRQAFRYHWKGTTTDARTVTEDERAPQFLVEEMRQRVARGPVSWELIFQLAADGDPTHDQLRRWPKSRPTIHAGTLTLTAEHPDQDVVEGMVFDPTKVPAGIECSDDPLLTFRSAVYGASHAARSNELASQRS
jgi:catalase